MVVLNRSSPKPDCSLIEKFQIQTSLRSLSQAPCRNAGIGPAYHSDVWTPSIGGSWCAYTSPMWRAFAAALWTRSGKVCCTSRRPPPASRPTGPVRAPMRRRHWCSIRATTCSRSAYPYTALTLAPVVVTAWSARHYIHCHHHHTLLASHACFCRLVILHQYLITV